MKKIEKMSPKEARALIRRGEWRKSTAGIALGYAQANLVVLPGQYAFDFLLYCQRNPKPCPLLEVLEPGKYITEFLAAGADVTTDIPLYNVYKRGKLAATIQDVEDLWQDDFVTFLLGCSYSFEEALMKVKIPVRHIEEDRTVPMYITNIPCNPAGIFKGPMVVSMRPVPEALVVKAVQVTSRYSAVHGGPVHIGNPAKIGVKDLHKPDFGDSVTIKTGEVPVFWACGVTPQAAVMKVKPDICITHAPGHMFISDILNEELAAM
ncbi:MAG: putative hydro-lyase [Deltaproteobacteria bacterium]